MRRNVRTILNMCFKMKCRRLNKEAVIVVVGDGQSVYGDEEGMLKL